MKLRNNLKVLTWFNFFTDFKLYAPVAVIYFSMVTGSFALGMSIFSIVMISSALFEIPTGVLSDHMGRRKTLIWGAVASVAYVTFYAIGQSYWILAIGAVFEGLSRSFYSGNNNALLYDTLKEEGKEEEFAEYDGRLSSMFQIALATAAVIGGILATFSYPLIMWLSVISQSICLVLSFRIMEPHEHSRRSGNIYAHLKEAYSNFITNKKLRLLSFGSIVGYGLGESSYYFQSAFYNTVWPVWAIGMATAAGNAAAATSFRFAGRLIKRFGAVNILISQNIYDRMTAIIATAFPTILSPALMSSGSAWYGVAEVSKSSLMQREFTDHQRATMGSLNSFAGSIFFGIISISLGTLADILSPARAILLLQLFQISNIFIYWKLFKHK
ncbi:MAG: MFS transporter [Weeksellaceae bacterium]